MTVGTQLAFDRLVRGVDEWAARSGRSDVFAQIGPGQYRPTSLEWQEFITPGECRRRMEEASVIVGHAGMGTIIGSLEIGKPVLIMPRQAGLGEHRNDHQIATAKHFRTLGSVAVAMDESELAEQLDAIDRLAAPGRISNVASPSLINAIRAFIHAAPVPAQAVEPKPDAAPEPVLVEAKAGAAIDPTEAVSQMEPGQR